MQNSQVEDQEKQDQRKNSAMEDSTAMTIEFLRARLLSERSVSRTTRQRADQLGKRVVELEEQLKIATEQRKKAEKATAEVLAILENSVVSDFSEVVDSGSDQEESLVCKPEENASTRPGSVGNDEDEISETSRSKGSKGEDGLLGSEVGAGDGTALEVSTFLGRNLSWRSSSSSPNSRGKSEKKSPDQPLARHKLHSFSSVGGSVRKQHLGKSCRQIRRRETRSADEDETDAPTVLEGAGMVSGDNCSCFGNKTEQEREVNEDLLKVALPENKLEHTSGNKDGMKVFPEAAVSCSIKEKRTGSDVDAGGSYRDVDMERVLEQQAQLIGRYEAEENAQREWEEKFRDANLPDSCEAGNQPDVTEERNEANTVFSLDEGLKSKEEQVCSRDKSASKNLPVGPTPSDLAACKENSLHKVTEHLVGPWHNGTLRNDSENRKSGPPVQGNPGATRNKGKQKQELAEDNYSNFNFGPSHPGPINIQQFHQQSSRLGSVLESLQIAKLSLKYEMGKLPSSSSEKAIIAVGDTQGPTDKTSNFMEFPISCDRLFRLPSESQHRVSPQVNFTNLGENLTSHLPDAGTGVATIDRYRSPYANIGTRLPSRDRYRSSYMNTEMRTAGDPYLKPYMDSGTENRNFYPYSDLGTRVTSNVQFPNSYLDGRSGVPGEDRYSVYDDRSRWNRRS